MLISDLWIILAHESAFDYTTPLDYAFKFCTSFLWLQLFTTFPTLYFRWLSVTKWTKKKLVLKEILDVPKTAILIYGGIIQLAVSHTSFKIQNLSDRDIRLNVPLLKFIKSIVFAYSCTDCTLYRRHLTYYSQ